MGRVKIPMKKRIDKTTGRLKITKDAIIKNAEELSIISVTASRLKDESELRLLNLSADERERLRNERFPISTIDKLREEHISRESEGDLSTEKAEKILKKTSRKVLQFKEPLQHQQQCDSSKTPPDIARSNRRHRRLRRSQARSRDLGSALFHSLPKFSPQFMRSLNQNQLPAGSENLGAPPLPKFSPPLPLFPAASYRHSGASRNSSSPATRSPIEPVPKFVNENQPPLLPPARDRHLRAVSRRYLPPEQSTFIRIKPPRSRYGDENRASSSKSSSPKKLDS